MTERDWENAVQGLGNGGRGGGEKGLISGEVYNRQFTVQPASKFSGGGGALAVGREKEGELATTSVEFENGYFEKGCRKNVHKTIPKGNMGYVQYTFPDTTVAVKPTFVALF